MSTGYTTYQQHEPLRAPSGWSVQEKRFVAQLEELFDDIYKRYNRLRMEDMSPAFRKSFKQIMDDGAELRHDLDVTAAGLSAEITRASTAEGTLSTSISATANGLSAEITRATTAEGTLSSTINSTATSMELTFKKIGASGYTASGITTIGENGVRVTHSSVSNAYTEMTASGFFVRKANGSILGGLYVPSGQSEVQACFSAIVNPNYPNFSVQITRMWSGESMSYYYGLGIYYRNQLKAIMAGLLEDGTGNVFMLDGTAAAASYDRIISAANNI